MKTSLKKFLKNQALNLFGVHSKSQLLNLPRKRIEKIFYSSYDTFQLISKLKQIGLQKGQAAFVHSSWDRFSHYTGKPQDLIKALLETIGPEGTLAMPCFPEIQDPKVIFDVKKTPSGAGLLTEVFRRFPGVKRSINLNHSICAIGPQAEYLIKDHHRSITSWDSNSPYYRIGEVHGRIFGLGFGRNANFTSIHCGESLLREEIYYFSLLFSSFTTYMYRDYNGNLGEHTFLPVREGTINTKKIARHLDNSKLKKGKVSNLWIYSIDADHLIQKTIELGRRGITMYTNPCPKRSLFYRINKAPKGEPL